MKKITLLIIIFISILPVFAQEGHKLNLGLGMSFGCHYYKSEISNPTLGEASIGYEYNPILFFGIEAGFKAGGFNQKVGYEELGNIKNVYKGTMIAPYIAPKLYLPISYSEKADRACYIYLENRLSYTRINLDLDRITNLSGSAHKYRVIYEIKAGYQYPIDNKWAINAWLGYNMFDFSKVRPEVIRFKNSTPIQIGIGFSYLIKE